MLFLNFFVDLLEDIALCDGIKPLSVSSSGRRTILFVFEEDAQSAQSIHEFQALFLARLFALHTILKGVLQGHNILLQCLALDLQAFVLFGTLDQLRLHSHHLAVSLIHGFFLLIDLLLQLLNLHVTLLELAHRFLKALEFFILIIIIFLQCLYHFLLLLDFNLLLICHLTLGLKVILFLLNAVLQKIHALANGLNTVVQAREEHLPLVGRSVHVPSLVVDEVGDELLEEDLGIDSVLRGVHHHFELLQDQLLFLVVGWALLRMLQMPSSRVVVRATVDYVGIAPDILS